MVSALIIGCQDCSKEYEQLQEKTSYEGYEFPFSTAYTEDKLAELLQFYTCPFCSKALYLSPLLLGLLNKFIGRNYHIIIEEYMIEFISSTISLSIPVVQEREKTLEIIEKLGLYNLLGDSHSLPSLDDIELIQSIATQFERAHWTIQIQSGKVKHI